MDHHKGQQWSTTLIFAIFITTFLLTTLYYWFAIADRYFVFLYYHTMGPRYPDTSPFSAVTSSRYWMAGLVDCGAIMMFTIVINALLGRLWRGYVFPAWWRIWAACAMPLVIFIPLITLSVNQPVLRWENASQVTLAVLVGLVLALLPGQMAAEQPGTLTILAFDGLGLMFFLLFLPALEDLGRWLAGGQHWYLWLLGLGLAGGLGLLVLATGLYIWWRIAIPRPLHVFGAGLAMAYLLMPLLHHVAFTNGYYYITNKDNFFARTSPGLQLATWLAVFALAWSFTRLRRYLADRIALLPYA